MKIRPIFKTIDIFSFIQFLSRQTNYIIKFFLLKVLYLVRIMEGKNGLFVSMPRRKVNGEYRDICYPCTKDFKQQFDQKVLEAYEQSQVQEAQKSPAPKEGQEENGPTMAM